METDRNIGKAMVKEDWLIKYILGKMLKFFSFLQIIYILIIETVF